MVVHPSDKRKTIGSIPIGTTMNIKQIIILLLISTFAFGFIDAADREQERESKIQTYYDGVYSGCILLKVTPNMPKVERNLIDQYCIARTTEAISGGLMELFYQYKTEIQPEDIIEDTTEF